MYFSIEVYRKDKNTYVASCPELDLEAPASTREQAVSRMEKILLYYLNSAKEIGIDPEILEFNSRKFKRKKEWLH